jgi:ADP-ribosylation factor related protein 1
MVARTVANSWYAPDDLFATFALNFARDVIKTDFCVASLAIIASLMQFSLLAGFWQYIFSKSHVNILILGLDDAGKTTILEQMKGIYKKVPGIPPAKIPPTVGLNGKTGSVQPTLLGSISNLSDECITIAPVSCAVGKMDVDGVSITFWDVGGQVRVRPLWDKYYADAHGLIFVIDSADTSRFEEAQLAFNAVREQGDLHGIPFMLLANKQDLPDACSQADIAAQFDTHKITTVPFKLQPVSALTW